MGEALKVFHGTRRLQSIDLDDYLGYWLVTEFILIVGILPMVLDGVLACLLSGSFIVGLPFVGVLGLGFVYYFIIATAALIHAALSTFIDYDAGDENDEDDENRNCCCPPVVWLAKQIKGMTWWTVYVAQLPAQFLPAFMCNFLACCGRSVTDFFSQKQEEEEKRKDALSREKIVPAIVLLGGKGSGKTAIVTRLLEDRFEPSLNPLRGSELEKITEVPDFKRSDGASASFQIVDMEASVGLRSKQWINEGRGFVLVFSLDDRKSFDDAVSAGEKVREAHEMLNKSSFSMVLVGNKLDILLENRKVFLCCILDLPTCLPDSALITRKQPIY